MPLVIFDLDNTLVDRTAAFRRWARWYVATHDLRADEIDWLAAADGDGFVPRREFIAAVRERYGLDATPEELLADYRERLVALLEVDPRVPGLLDGLRGAGWRVAIATNGANAQQRAKIRRTGLSAHVDAVVVSEEIGAAKPDRRIFHVAAERCGVRLSDGGWMVGDCPVRDIAGGRRAGLRTIWLRRGRDWDGADPPPDVTIDAVVDAADALTHPDPT